jgi:hypothetical protein
MKIANIKSSTDFCLEIEKIVKERRAEYHEAVLMYCEVHNIEIETAATLIRQNSTLKAKIQVEAENINMVKKTSARLPI